MLATLLFLPVPPIQTAWLPLPNSSLGDQGDWLKEMVASSRKQLATSSCATTGILLCIPLPSLTRD